MANKKPIVPSADFKVELTQGGMKAAMKDSGATSTDLLMVPIGNLKIVAGLNVRVQDADHEAQIEYIKNSIIANGFYKHHPLPGYAGKEGELTFIYVTGGFTRYEAAKRAIAEGAAIENLPVVLKPAGTSMADLTVALAIDNTGKPLKPYERAIVVKRLVGYGMEEPEIATKLDVSEQYIKDLLFLLSLPMPIQKMVIDGSTSAGTAIQTARKHGNAKAVQILQGALTDAAAAGNTGTARTAPVTAGRAAAQASGAKKIVPKKTLFLAIDYAISLADTGIDWLSRWRQGEKDALKELDSYKRPRKGGKAKAKTTKAKGGRKPAAAKAKTNGNVSHDVGDAFDIGVPAIPATVPDTAGVATADIL